MAGFLLTNRSQKDLLKIYDKESDIPEGLRAEYKQSGTKWVPDLSDDHPVLVLNAELKREKGVEEAKVKKLRSDLDDALEAGKTTGIPRGHVAVLKADADLLEKLKPLGTAEEITTKLTEHKTLKEESDKRTREDKLALVAKQLEFDAEVFKRLPGLPDFDIRDGKDGKKQVIALVKDGDKTVEKPALEYIEASPDHSPFLTALRTRPAGVTVHGTGGTAPQPQPGDPFAWAREFGKSINEQGKPTVDLLTSFGLSKSA